MEELTRALGLERSAGAVPWRDGGMVDSRRIQVALRILYMLQPGRIGPGSDIFCAPRPVGFHLRTHVRPLFLLRGLKLWDLRG